MSFFFLNRISVHLVTCAYTTNSVQLAEISDSLQRLNRKLKTEPVVFHDLFSMHVNIANFVFAVLFKIKETIKSKTLKSNSLCQMTSNFTFTNILPSK